MICCAASTRIRSTNWPGVHSSLAEADAREMASAHTNALGERFDSKVFAEVLEHPYLKLAQWFRGDGLMREHVAVLCLSARTYKEHDEETRDLESCVVSVIFFDQGEREVDPGGDTCRCVNRAITQVNWLGPHHDFGVFLGKTVAGVPMCNGLLPVELRRPASARRNAPVQMDATRLPCDFRDPGDEVGIVTAALCAGTARDYKGVDGTVDGGDGSCIGEHDAAIGVKSSFRAGVCKLNLVLRCVGKDL